MTLSITMCEEYLGIGIYYSLYEKGQGLLRLYRAIAYQLQGYPVVPKQAGTSNWGYFRSSFGLKGSRVSNSQSDWAVG